VLREPLDHGTDGNWGYQLLVQLRFHGTGSPFMTQTIDPAKLKAAAEHLKRVLERYPDSAEVKGLLRALSPLIERAKARRVREPFEEELVPCGRSFAEGMYTQYGNPSVDDAYYAFAAELRGGRSPEEDQLIADTQAIIDARNAHE
jgi:hypothetical protein